MNPMVPSAHLRRQATAVQPMESFAADVMRGLTASPKWLPCKYLYDDLGSALFEAITLLPEYGVTRAEESLLRERARSIAERLVPGVMVAELGSGGGKKTASVLDAILAFQAEVAYHPIDISAGALGTCELRLGAIPGVRVRSIEALYLDGLLELGASREPWPPLLVLFLGSNIGNFDVPEAETFLSSVRGCLRDGDSLLLGADLRKPVDRLLSAYDDPTGVTAAFNLNLLARINRELDAAFDLRNFAHQARWCDAESRVEMHLVSRIDQDVRIGALDMTVPFAAGETIWTESSYKYDLAALDKLARAAGFEVVGRWTHEAWGFAESLWRVQ
jgi:L-histidine Nalpha-methyltransferase